MTSLATELEALAGLAATCAQAATRSASSTDDELLQFASSLASSERLLGVAAARIAAEVAHRSRRELGYSGLAQSRGSRSPEALVQQVTGVSSPTARRLVRVGALLSDASARAADPTAVVSEPWLAAVAEAASVGRISSEAVRLGLGSPNETVTAAALAEAARQLTTLALTLTLESLAARAREARDNLDVAGVALREEERRSRRYLRLIPQHDGMTRITGLLDPESAAVVGNAIDAATSPRRGGPRFVDPGLVARDEALVTDERTTEQIALDALVELTQVAVLSRTSRSIGARRPAIRVLVTQADLDRREGVGYIEGQNTSVSIVTVERLACDAGYVPIAFDEGGAVLDLGQTQRLHTAQQRIAISARDGGCIAPGCDRPASWAEVHHINEFAAGGDTSVDDGVLLCRHHHMLMHNNGWQIRRIRSNYHLVPPASIDRTRTPVLLETKSPALRRLRA